MPIRVFIVCAVLIMVLLGGTSVSSQAAEVVVFSAVAAKSALKEIAPTFERESQHKLVLWPATAAPLKAEITYKYASARNNIGNQVTGVKS
jgi:ABC-type molybdate transport system substrate-binding protein